MLRGKGRLLSGIALPLGIAMAVGLVIIGQIGGFDIAVFVAVMTVGTVAALSSLEFGVLALILVASVDGFLKGLSPGWHTQLLKDYLLAICILRWAWLSALGHRRKSVRQPVAWAIGLFALWCLMQLLNARNAGLVIGLAGFRVWVIWLPVFLLAYDYMKTRLQVERFVLFVLALMIPLAAYAIVQYEIGLDHLYALGPGFDVYLKARYATAAYEIQLRPPSTMISPHSLAAACAMAILLGIGAVGYFRRESAARWFAVAAMPLIGVALLLTAVRNAYGSAAIAILMLLALVRRPGLILAALLVGGIATYGVDTLTGGRAMARMNTIVTDPDYTRARILTPFTTAISWAARHPLGGGIATGVGRGRMLYGVVSAREYAPENRTPWAENEYARSMIELGIPGFLLFMIVLAMCVYHVYRAYRASRQLRDRWLIAGIFAAVISMLLRLLVGSALYGWPEGILFWCYVAIAIRMPEIEAEEARAAESPATPAAVPRWVGTASMLP